MPVLRASMRAGSKEAFAACSAIAHTEQRFALPCRYEQIVVDMLLDLCQRAQVGACGTASTVSTAGHASLCATIPCGWRPEGSPSTVAP